MMLEIRRKLSYLLKDLKLDQLSLYYLNYTINIVFMGLPPIFRWLVLILFESMVLCLFLLKSAAWLFWRLVYRTIANCLLVVPSVIYC